MNAVRSMTDMRASMRKVSCPQRARQILSLMRGRLSDIEFVRWPRLEASLRAELVELEGIARARGLVSGDGHGNAGRRS